MDDCLGSVLITAVYFEDINENNILRYKYIEYYTKIKYNEYQPENDNIICTSKSLKKVWKCYANDRYILFQSKFKYETQFVQVKEEGFEYYRYMHICIYI